ncbi:hypothetical protein SK128_015325 [Halocaridina rubra]|uniref:Uncharacterized protein n=1 Tax=Halocaridina rubra TaxID=373956 RepID=A0AAN8XGF0_HALRR
MTSLTSYAIALAVFSFYEELSPEVDIFLDLVNLKAVEEWMSKLPFTFFTYGAERTKTKHMNLAHLVNAWARLSTWGYLGCIL